MPSLIAKEELINEYNKFRSPKFHHSACLAASNAMFIYPDGYIMPCCHSKDYILGKYPEQTLHDIWFGKQRSRLLHELSQYNFDLGCEGCYNTLALKNYEGVSALRFDSFGEKIYPSNIEFQLHNTCNLECVMCSGVLSSSIRKNREGLPSTPMLFNEKFVEELDEFIPHLTHATFSGGESFMIKIYYNIWEKIIRMNPACHINIITNGSVMNERIKDLLPKGNFTITISIDGFNKSVYEGIRKNAEYELLLQNLNHFSEARKTTNTRLTLNFCPMPQNWHLIPAFISKCNELNCDFYFSIVYLPHPHSLLSLSTNELEKIEHFLFENEPRNFVSDTKRIKYRSFIKSVTGWKENADSIKGRNITQESFLAECNKKIEDIFASQVPMDAHRLSQQRFNGFVTELKEQLDFDVMQKNLLEKDSLLRMLEETAKRNDQQAKEGLIYFFGKK